MNSNFDSDCQLKSDINYENHWDAVYGKVDAKKLGWYEENATPTLQLIEACKLSKDAVILNVGSGSTTLIDNLLELNYTNVIASDLSSSALKSLKLRLGDEAKKVQFIVDDLTNPTQLNTLSNIDVWNDRAVLHFFLSEKDRKTYFNLLRSIVKKEGYVIIAAFAIEGALKCCGLGVYQYDSRMLKEALGSDFELQQEFNYSYKNPNGDPRPYIYTLFKRVNA